MQHIQNLQKLFGKNFIENPLVESFEAGKIHISSGRIVACDPIITNDKEPFNTLFPIGDFPVLVHKERDSGKIAYVEILFAEEGVEHWNLALCQGQEIQHLGEGEIFGFPVESGMACLMDIETQTLLNQLETQMFKDKGDLFLGIYDEFFHSYFFNDNGEMQHQYNFLSPNPQLPNNMIAFEAGYGEGFYAVYIGENKNNQPVKLIAEFIEIL